MALVRNETNHAITLDPGPSIGPGETANVDLALELNADLLAEGRIRITDAAVSPPAPDGKRATVRAIVQDDAASDEFVIDVSAANPVAPVPLGTDGLPWDASTLASDTELAAAVAAVGGRFRGAYASGTAYKAKDLVTQAGSLYSRNADGTPSGAFVGGEWTQVTAGSSGHVIEDEGSALTARSNLNFTGSGVTAVDSGGKTVVTIPGGALTPTAVKTGAYAAAAGDLVPVDTTSGSVTVTLPSAPADGTQVAVKHVIQTGTNTVTIARGGSDVFNKASGSTSLTLTLLNQAVLLQYKASTGVWYVLADDLTLSGLDGRFAAAVHTHVKSEVGLANVDNTSDANKPVSTAQAAADLVTLQRSARLAFSPSGDRNANLAFVGLSNGTDTDANSKIAHVADRNLVYPRALFANWGPSQVDSITISAGIELPSGAFVPVYFNGSRTITLIAGQSVESDRIACFIAKGATYKVRTRVVVTAGQKWMNNAFPANGTTEGNETGTGTTDKTISGTISFASSASYTAICLFSSGVNALPFIYHSADSIGTGYGTSYTSAPNGLSTNDAGFLHQAILGESRPFILSALAGELLATVSDLSAPSAVVTQRRFIESQAAIVYCQHIVNDVVAGTAAATIQQSLINRWTLAATNGARVIQTTCTPISSSTDSFVTVANQTTNANNSKRVTVNQWLRDGAPIDATTKTAVAVGSSSNTIRAGESGHPLYAVDNIAAAVENSQDDGKWKVRIETGNTTSGSPTITNATGSWTIGIGIGDNIGSPFGAGARLLNVVGTTLTANQNAPSTATGVTLVAPYTIDGTHPSNAGYNALAAAVTKANLN